MRLTRLAAVFLTFALSFALSLVWVGTLALMPNHNAAAADDATGIAEVGAGAGAGADADADAKAKPTPTPTPKKPDQTDPKNDKDEKGEKNEKSEKGEKSINVTHTFLALGTQTFIVEYDQPGGESNQTAEQAQGDQLFSDFEQDKYVDWVASGDAFGRGPMPLSAIPDDPIEIGADGAKLIDSRNLRNGNDQNKGDAQKGVMISKTFTIEKDYIRLLVGGTADPQRTCVKLIVEGKTVKTLAGRGTGAMRLEHINVSKFKDKRAYLKVIDNHDRGFIRLDHIVFSDAIREQKRRIGAGKIVWRYNRTTRDGWLLPDGNILLAVAPTSDENAKVVEVDRELREQFKWQSDQEDIASVQRLGNGNTLIAEVGKNPRVIEVNKEGEIQVTVLLKAQTSNLALQIGTVRKLANGNYLVTEIFDKLVREYDKDSEVVWESELDDWPNAAIRLDNGNTLVSLSSGGKVVELNKAGKVVWQVSGDDLPGVTLHDAAGIQRLDNGNTIICDQDAGRKRGPKIMEITPDKHIVWTYRDTSRMGIVNAHITHTNGERLGQALR